MKVSYAVIGGTGVYNSEILENIKNLDLENSYGKVRLTVGEYRGKSIAFLPRHGALHSIPPHLINYRANIWALKELGVKKIISTAAVGSLNKEMEPGAFVLVDQFIDFAKGRPSTFYEGGEKGVLHVDLSQPYCPYLRQVILNCSQQLKLQLHEKGTYVCTEGPRFETPAEIKMFSIWGGDLVGMTNVPEVVLAREAGICYATVGMVTNFAAGISPQALTHSEVVETMKNNSENIRRLIMKTLEEITVESSCSCIFAAAEAGKF